MKYLSNKELYKEIIVSKNRGILTRDAEKMLILLGNKLIKKFSYEDPFLKGDCLQSGFESVFRNWRSFNEDKTENAFAYFTEIFKRGFAKSFNEFNRRENGQYIKDVRINGLYEDGSDLNI